MHYYRLDERGHPVIEKNMAHWAVWLESATLNVAKTHLPGNVVITTTFRGFSSKNPPEVWQTEVRGSLLDSQITTCAGDWKDAQKMHEQTVKTVTSFLEKNQPNQNQ